MNYTRPPLAIEIESIRDAFVNAKKRGIRLRYLTEITKDNNSYCKDLMSIVDELRHLDKIRGSFIISETEYLAPIILFEKGKVASQIIHSNVEEIVEQQQYVFDTLWSKAIPAEQRIRQIEEGIEPIRTTIIEDQQEIIKEIKRKNNAANKLSICTSLGGMQMSYNYLFDSYKNVVDKYKKGESKEGMRWLMNVQRNDKLNEAVVSIKDTGVGIDPDILPRLFSRFATKAETSGTGLGLFISKSIIEAHGGRIWAENNSDGKGGATFSFSLPISKEK